MTIFVDAKVFKIKKFRKETTKYKNKSDFQCQPRTITTRKKLDELQINSFS